jgi:preprotein translocase subunit SecB
MELNEHTYKKFGIQLARVIVRQFDFKMKNPNVSVNPQTVLDKIKLLSGFSEYDKEDKSFISGVKAIIDDESLSFSCSVDIIGFFEVKEDISTEKIKYFAEKNSPYILQPYLREHLYSITLRGGITPIILDLKEIPFPNIEEKVDNNN